MTKYIELPMNRIPPGSEPVFCAFEACLETATYTACQEPGVCNDPFCLGLVACDEHAEGLADLITQMLCHPERAIIEVVPPEGEWDGHD
jgi:hypothetical protein